MMRFVGPESEHDEAILKILGRNEMRVVWVELVEGSEVGQESVEDFDMVYR